MTFGALASAGCDTYHFVAGTWQEDHRHPVQALAHYQKYLAGGPKEPRACAVRLRAALIQRDFGRCAEARANLEAAARDFPQDRACSELAKKRLLSCPDYFPLDEGRTWVYVDSESQGKAMRLDWELRVSSDTGGGKVSAVLYAGDKRNRASTEAYEKRDWAVWRSDVKPAEPFLHYPFAQDQAWSGLRGKTRIDWLVMSATETVKSAAGTFTDCLKVRERDSRYPQTWRFDYYCPDVGRVKTTLGGKGYENPNTELLRFGKM